MDSGNWLPTEFARGLWCYSYLLDCFLKGAEKLLNIKEHWLGRYLSTPSGYSW